MAKTEHVNWTLVIAISVLTLIGIVNLYSALGIWGEGSNVRLIWMQIAWVIIGILFLLMFAFSDYRIFERLAYPLYFISLALVAATLFTGHTVYGHKSWLGFGGFGIQPSEFAKVTTLIVLARYFSNNPQPEGFDFTGLIQPFILTIIPTGLVLLQKDFGSALFFMLIFASFAWFGKLKRRVILIVLILGVGTAIFGYNYMLSDYQKARIVSFLNPEYDLKGSGYHTAQSRIAVGSGRVFGKGYLKGNINKLKYLPEKHTDFVFPVLAEEWGFAGSLFTLAFYYLLLSCCIEIAKEARDRFGLFLSVGIGAYLFWQIFINLGGVLGIMPLTGVTLPFLSYGGSSTVSIFSAIGILFSVSSKRFVF